MFCNLTESFRNMLTPVKVQLIGNDMFVFKVERFGTGSSVQLTTRKIASCCTSEIHLPSIS